MPLPHSPVAGVLPILMEALRRSPVTILTAPPGAGKTTLVPLAVLEDGLLQGSRIVMLEPRRLAARRAAEYMASLLGERPGGRVGYRIRGETRSGPGTKIEVVTEGILTRMLQSSPDLPGTGLVIFDEFHERSIHADLGLALTLDVQEHLRPDIRVLVMSATPDTGALLRLLRDPAVVTSEGKRFPVETVHRSFPPEGPVERHVVDTVRRALSETEGDILVFLPGQREIRRVGVLLEPVLQGTDVHLHFLYGEAPATQQLAALLPAPAGERKIIFSTNVAETSLTIDGIRVVVDSGLMRVARFDPRRGMSGLETVPVSRASADQRRGRAGRQAPGTCYRLWTVEQEAGLSEYNLPEILSTDLAPLALELAGWGSDLRFIDPPPTAHLAQARSLLVRLGALDPEGRITALGKAVREFPVHPRLAHMILSAGKLGLTSLACEAAAQLEEGSRADREPDFRARWHGTARGRTDREERVRREAGRLRALAGVHEEPAEEDRLGILLALAYPDRIGRRRGEGRYLLSGGTGAALPAGSTLGRSEFIAAADLDGTGTEAMIRLAAPVEREELLSVFGDHLVERLESGWDGQAITGRRSRMLGAIALEERSVEIDPASAAAVMLEAVRTMGPGCLNWSTEARSIRERSEWLRRSGFVPPGWPDLSDEGLRADVQGWLGPHIDGVTRKSQLERLDTAQILLHYLGHHRLSELNRLAPVILTVPTGSRIRIDYEAGPVLAVKLQEMFGQTTTPAVAGGRAPVLIHLLSPAGRPLAVTQDLPSFWRNVYPDVRKEMRGRYPKHPWPEDPLAAAPTRKTTKPRSR